MANTITGLIPDIYAAMDQVSREMVGFIPAVTIDAQLGRAALNETIVSPVAPAAAATDITPAVTPPDDGDQVIGNRTMTITKARRVPVRWNGEQSKALNNGPGLLSVRANQFLQAMRTLVNEIESDIALMYKKSSRAYGSAGTAPFASTLADTPQLLKILMDNGCTAQDLQLVINTTAGANLRSLAQLTKANEAGTDSILTQGILIDLHGFKIRESAQVKTHTKGTGSGYLVNNGSNIAAGATTITVDTGTGTVVAGDVLTNSESGRDANKYVVGTALAAGDLVLNAPGLVTGWTNNDALAVGNNYAANLAFSRSAIVLATRAPALPEGGDSADDRMMITDPRSGLSFEVSIYRQYRQVQYEIAIAWGVANFKPEWTATLLG